MGDFFIDGKGVGITVVLISVILVVEICFRPHSDFVVKHYE